MPDKSISLFNLEALSAPVTKLIETVSSGIGVLDEPRRIRERAKAEVDAAKIKAKGAIEIQKLALRASHRISVQEVRRQRNLEAIIKKASEQLPSKVSEERVDEDWTAQFLNYSQDVSNEEMQLTWARLLAGEVAQPGSFSPRTLQLVRLLCSKDAALFRTFCNFVWKLDGELCHINYVDTDKILEASGLPYDALLHLESIGLISMHSNVSFKPTKGNTLEATYFENNYLLKDEKTSGGIPVRILTDIGKELVPLCEATGNSAYHESIIGTWRHWEAIIESSE